MNGKSYGMGYLLDNKNIVLIKHIPYNSNNKEKIQIRFR